MNTILLTHCRRYPQMELRDAVKLLYQAEFGGGHMISDEALCRQRLMEEYAATPQDTETALLEDIGNGMVRVHLAALDHAGYAPEALYRDFIRSAAMTKGSMTAFRHRLALLKDLTRSGRMPFSLSGLEAYLAEYEAAGFPPVSHSECYRRAYRPAYRVVAAACLPPELSGRFLSV